jgi:hypothetical protein
VRLREPLVARGQGRIVDRQFGRHDFLECWSVTVRGPHLELVLIVVAVLFVVANQLQESGRWPLRTDSNKFGVKCVKHQLEGGQSLLAVNDRANLKVARRIRKLLENDGTEKVRLKINGRRPEEPVRDTLNVSPERFPLILPVPNVGTLKEWHEEPLRHIEDRMW